MDFPRRCAKNGPTGAGNTCGTVSKQAHSKKDGVHYMGIYIYMPISRSVTHEEWRDVYQETLRLVEAFPLAERRTVSLRGIPTSCLVRTEEREFR